MNPIEHLMEEHKQIKNMLKVIHALCDKLDAGEQIPDEHLDELITFLTLFADKCHHGKEEDLLFKAMVQAGFSEESGPIAVMLAEHRQGRAYVGEMRAAFTQHQSGKESLLPNFVSNARSYANLLVDHIYKEDNILYPMAEAHLPTQVMDTLASQFEAADRDQVGLDHIQEYLNIVTKMTELYTS